MDDARTRAVARDPELMGSPSLHARVGQRLGRYELLTRLAHGGMGVVYAARLVGAHGVERLVAIKTLRPMTGPGERAGLLAEAQLTARLHHRNIVSTIELGEIDDIPYVVMELVDGVALSRLFAVMRERGERLAPELAAWMVMQVALGLHAAHELTDTEGAPMALVHRDVSPHNVLLSTSGEAKIGDFGIAKFDGRRELTATGMIKGKFAYMSPEQANGRDLDRRSDIFALGVLLWEALTGERLFLSETPARTLFRVSEETPRAPDSVRPEVSAALSRLTMTCLEKDPASRFASAGDLAVALRACLREQGSPVDESDLASLVRRLFGEERKRAMEELSVRRRIRPTSDAGRHSPSRPPPPTPEDASVPPPVAFVTQPRSPGASRSRTIATAAFALAAFVLIGVSVAVFEPARRRASVMQAELPAPAVGVPVVASSSAGAEDRPPAAASASSASKTPPASSARTSAPRRPPSAPRRPPLAPGSAPRTPAVAGVFESL